MEPAQAPCETGAGAAAPHEPNSASSGSSSGTGYYPRNGERDWRAGERRMLDITRDKPVKVCVRVVVPARDHPKFNFVGKLLGPKGNSLKRLQEDTMCKMAVLGRGSMKDRQKEEELRVSGDPKYSHLAEELHVEISAFATPAEAHARIAYALAELRRFLVPDYNDDIRQEQMIEMQILSGRQRSSPSRGSDETLPPDPRQRMPATAPTQPGSADAASPQVQREYSPPTDRDMHHHHHHQLPPHSVMVSQSQLLPPTAHHILAQNSILGGDVVTMNGGALGSVGAVGVHGGALGTVGVHGGALGAVGVLHPALRGVEPAVALASQGVGGGAAGATRKRPLLGGARATMSPTKRAVMTLLARARAAQTKHPPVWKTPAEHPGLLPLLRDDLLAGVGVNIHHT